VALIHGLSIHRTWGGPLPRLNPWISQGVQPFFMELTMNRTKKLCGRYWRHAYELIGGRDWCRQCGLLNPINTKPYDRFWDHVDLHAEGGHWLWLGAKDYDGYGFFALTWDGVTRTMRAHRYAWYLLRGEIPGTKQIDHLCGVRGCVYPGHMEPVTKAENARRANIKPTCKRGHKMKPPNLYYDKKKRRKCRACIRWHNTQKRNVLTDKR